MAIFGKKKQKEASEDSNKEVNKAEYKIVLVEKLGGTVRTIKSFFASRFNDEDDNVVYLKNDKLKFIEIFPQQITDFKNYTEEEVNKLLKKYTDILQKERDVDSDAINDKDIEYEILKLKAKKRSFKFDENASYLSFDENSRPTFYFLREGSTFHPLKWDTDTKTIFTPSDNRKKSASLSLRNKQNKYNTKKLLDGASIILLIVGFIMAAGGGYFMFKANAANNAAFDSYDKSEIAAAQRACLESINQVAGSVALTAEEVEKISTNVEENINKPQTVINGVIPE